MKKIVSILASLVLSLTVFSQKEEMSTEELLKYKATKLVNDFTGTLTSDQEQALERKLVAFDDSTSTQIAVVIIPTLNGNDISDYAVKLGRAWGIGGKEFSNGVLLLIDVGKGERKLHIATGYGVEGALPDITCKQIIEDIIVPNFKGDDYYRGIEEGTDAIMQAVKGEYKAPEGDHKNSGRSAGRIIFIIVVIIIFLALSGGGKGGGSFMSRRGYTAWTIGNILSNMGRSGGGGWSGGGGSSGGFGGFGGGSFGGGGASGSW